jgi:general secretion pathway protein J
VTEILDRENGFTLLELLVAMTLLAFFSVALVAGLRIGSRFWTKSQSSALDGNTVRNAQRTIAKDLTDAYPKLMSPQATESFIDFEGTPQHMEFVSAASQSTGQMSRVTLDARPDGDSWTLEYRATPELARDTATGNGLALLSHVKSIAFAYFGADSESNDPAWHATWQHARTLPLLVRVRIATAPPLPLSTELIVRPKIDADVSCTFDAVHKFCQGR